MPNSVAVVTGASQGIGRSTAIRLARDFPSTVLVARDRSHLEDTAAALCGDRLMVTGRARTWARVGAARAERAEGRSGARSGAGSAPAERSAAGLEPVEKVVTRLR